MLPLVPSGYKTSEFFVYVKTSKPCYYKFHEIQYVYLSNSQKYFFIESNHIFGKNSLSPITLEYWNIYYNKDRPVIIYILIKLWSSWLYDWLFVCVFEAVRTNPGYGMATLIYNNLLNLILGTVMLLRNSS